MFGETTRFRMSAQMPAVGFPPLAAEAEVSYYDREGEFWEEYNVRIDSRHKLCAYCCSILLSTQNPPTQQGETRKRRTTLTKTNPVPLPNAASPSN
jgi:hypothetical protein